MRYSDKRHFVFYAAAVLGFAGVAPSPLQAQISSTNPDPMCRYGFNEQEAQRLRTLGFPSSDVERLAVYRFSTQCGAGARATAQGATAIGANAIAAADATALGRDARANGVASTSIGTESRAHGHNSTALGSNAIALHNGSTAIGQGAVTTAANQVRLGNAGSSVSVGDIAASTAAQVGPVSVVTVDAGGTLGRTALPNFNAQAGQIAALEATQNALAQQVDTMFDLRQVDRRDTREGIAAAVAISAAPMPSAPGRTSYIVNGATFRGEHAIGGSIMHRLNTEEPFAITAGFSYAGNKNNAARVGVAGEF